MAHSRLGRLLREIHDTHRASALTGIPVDEVQDMRRDHDAATDAALLGAGPIDRREFLRRAGMTGVGLAALPALGALAACSSPKAAASPKPATTGAQGPRIAVVGAGLSGMTTAYRLWQAGYSSTVYEASERLFGRSWTLDDYFDNDQYAEHGGEFINSDHHAIIDLAHEVGLKLDDLYTPYPDAKEITYLHGHVYTNHQAFQDYSAIYATVHQQFTDAPWPITYDQHTKEAVRLDHMTVAEWIEQYVPGGAGSDLGALLALDYITEDGLDPGEQSALNLVTELGESPQNTFKPFGLQDWRYQVKGGNGRVVGTLAGLLPHGTAVTRMPLVAVRSNTDATTTLTFEPDGGSPADVTADIVVLCLPFTALRRVDLSKASFSKRKMRAINTFGMGTNSKLHMQFSQRVWYGDGIDGGSTSDTGYQETWEVDMGSKAPTGVLVNYTGGSVGAGYPTGEAHAPAAAKISRRALNQIEPVMPGVKGAFSGKAFLDCWAKDPWHLGSYACFLPGQYTGFNGIQAATEGSVYFAGEATSLNFQGFMNGAVQSGNDAAAAILATL